MGTPALVRRSSLGDGPATDQDLKDFVVGRTISGVQVGMMTEDGEAVLGLEFEGGDRLVLAARLAPLEGRVHGLKTDFSVAFLSLKGRRIYLPGQSRF